MRNPDGGRCCWCGEPDDTTSPTGGSGHQICDGCHSTHDEKTIPTCDPEDHR